MSDDAGVKKRGLGRGLNALFEDDEAGFSGDASMGSAAPAKATQFMAIDLLESGTYQPRQFFDDEAILELSESIAEHGILQPILVRLKPGFDDRYEIIAGERRWRAAQKAQLHEVPVLVKEMSDEKALEIALIENLQREDLNPVEEALGYKQLMDEFSHTQEQAAKALGKSRSHFANMLRLLNLPPKILEYVREGKLSAGHGRALVTAENPEALARKIMDEGLSVREAEKLLGSSKSVAGKKSAPKPEKDVNTIALEDELANNLGMKVSIDMHKDGKGGRSGTFKVSFKDLDQLDILLRRLSA